MHASLIRSPFARCCGLFLLVLALLLVSLAPTTGLAQGQGAGAALGLLPPMAMAGGDKTPNGSQGSLIEAREMGPGGAPGFDLTGQPFLAPLVIPAAEFRNDGQAPNGYYFPPLIGYIRPQLGTLLLYLMAPAYLPQSATVTQLSVTFYDNGGTSRPWLKLYRVDKDFGIVDEMAMVTTSATSSNVQHISDLTINHPLVVYPNFSYYVGAQLHDSSQRLYSVRIYY